MIAAARAVARCRSSPVGCRRSGALPASSRRGCLGGARGQCVPLRRVQHRRGQVEPGGRGISGPPIARRRTPTVAWRPDRSLSKPPSSRGPVYRRGDMTRPAAAGVLGNPKGSTRRRPWPASCPICPGVDRDRDCSEPSLWPWRSLSRRGLAMPGQAVAGAHPLAVAEGFGPLATQCRRTRTVPGPGVTTRTSSLAPFGRWRSGVAQQRPVLADGNESGAHRDVRRPRIGPLCRCRPATDMHVR